jgi:diguanylate cyclase (GGDEF)-like protein/PAS domain S-box-containing protein
LTRDISYLTHEFVSQIADHAIFLLDPKGVIISWNEGAAQIKGYTVSEIIGQHFSIFYTQEDKMVAHPERELILAASIGRFEEQGWRVRKDGTRFWAHVEIIALNNEKGALKAFGKIVRDITASKQAFDQRANVMALLETTSRTDFLTGLDNRRSLYSILQTLLASATRHGRIFVFAMMDLDNFKSYNDQHGHQDGDLYLRSAANAWRLSLRKEDVLARYGGEEFAILIPDCSLDAALGALNRIQKATPMPMTCSIGATQWDGEENSATLVGRADRALYLAKDNGRNRIETLPARSVLPSLNTRDDLHP